MGEFRDRGSKFIAIASPVSSTEQADAFLQEIKKEYHDARHHCYAYRIGPKGDEFRANDDGEPGHSAGDPILGQIRSMELTNVMIIVVRYFGGTKLGVGGLINAYRTAAEEALKNSRIIKRPVVQEFTITYDYESTNEVMRLYEMFGVTVVSSDYTQRCHQVVAVNVGLAEGFLSRVNLLNDLGHEVKTDQNS